LIGKVERATRLPAVGVALASRFKSPVKVPPSLNVPKTLNISAYADEAVTTKAKLTATLNNFAFIATPPTYARLSVAEAPINGHVEGNLIDLCQR